MVIFLIGISCVGKSTIGASLAKRLGSVFYDFDIEIEQFYGKPTGALKAQWLTNSHFRRKAAVVLKKILQENGNGHAVVALPPSGLRAPYYKLIKAIDGVVLWIRDSPENILERITFYDQDSRLIEKRLTDKEKKAYLKEIQKDMAYFRRFHCKADYPIDIDGMDVEQSSEKIEEFLKKIGDAGREKRGT